ncbi:hypothetical protein I3842_08G121700 [Carya illinoinensis]|uniref:Uncharacterized protein n=1 Tax=Carya illinoinensis TaxID=32201 RepID=A0A922EBR9_CARIL|nr:hypothetical protein I3842_08G121700 [Carya illinoinensis]
MVKQRSLTPRGAPRANKQNHQSRSKTPDSNSRRNPLRNIPQKTIQNSQGSRPKPQPRTSPPTENLSAQLGVKKEEKISGHGLWWKPPEPILFQENKHRKQKRKHRNGWEEGGRSRSSTSLGRLPGFFFLERGWSFSH